MSASSRQPIAKRARKSENTGCIRAFLGLFVLLGLAMFYWITLAPALKILSAKGWQETPCTITASKVVAHSDSDGTTYSVDIAFRYTFSGREYTSNQYSFSVGSSGGRTKKDRVVQQYPAGLETECYVNPAVPQEAVIDRGLQWELIFGAFGLVISACCLFGMRAVGAEARKKKTIPDALTLGALPATSGPVALEPKSTPLKKFLGLLAFSVIWNGFISIFVYLVFISEDAHKAPFFAKAIVGLFAVIGVFMLFGAISSALALLNPRIVLTASRREVPLGGELQFSWVVTGRVHMLRRMIVTFEGQEEATYRRGTDTVTDQKVFLQIPVFETSDQEYLQQGNSRVVVPENLMHTFEASNNKVLWRLKVKGEIPRWPDVEDEYLITVLPK